MKRMSRADYERMVFGEQVEVKKKKRKKRQGGAGLVVDAPVKRCLVPHAVNGNSCGLAQNMSAVDVLAIKKLRKDLRSAVIKKLNRSEIDAVMELVQKFLGTRVPIDPESRRKLRRHRKHMLTLADPRASMKSKKEVLSQRGGIIPAILPIVAAAMGPLVGSIMGKALQAGSGSLGDRPLKNEARFQNRMNRRSRLLKHLSTLGALGTQHLRDDIRSTLVNKLSESELDGVSELITNFLKANIPVDSESLRKLKKDREYLHALADPRTAVRVKKNILCQRGGIIPALLPLAAATLGPLVGSFASRIFNV